MYLCLFTLLIKDYNRTHFYAVYYIYTLVDNNLVIFSRKKDVRL
jgi:hypothetical protein